MKDKTLSALFSVCAFGARAFVTGKRSVVGVDPDVGYVKSDNHHMAHCWGTRRLAGSEIALNRHVGQCLGELPKSLDF